jgi:hypothetical protein
MVILLPSSSTAGRRKRLGRSPFDRTRIRGILYDPFRRAGVDRLV